MAVGSAFLLVMVGLTVWGWKTQSWPTVPGRILSSSWGVDQRQAGERSSSSRVRLVYEYQVGEKIFHGHRIQVGGLGMTERQASAVTSRYEPGRIVSVAYHPNDPARSVLEPGPPSGVEWFGVAGLVTTLLGLHYLRAPRRAQAQPPAKTPS